MPNTTTLAELIGHGREIPHHRPWPRAVIGPELWRDAARQLAAQNLALLGFWGDKDSVHMALHDEAAGAMGVVSLECPNRQFPSVALAHPPALHLEATIRDLFGLQPGESPDSRPWLDHGRWGVRHPLGTPEPPHETQPYVFLPSEGESLHEIAVGPVHAGIIEPGHFRFTATGETVIRLEERLGYTHKGIEGLMAGADIGRAARLAGRTSGDSAVAYGIAFARAVEAALEIEVPPRAVWLRALMAELERLANHFGDIGAICNDAAFSLMHAHCGILRERVLRAADLCFGHRLMRDRVVPGGVAVDLADHGIERLRTLIGEIRGRFPALVELYDNTASLQDRTVGTGILQSPLARQYACGGYVGRASGRTFDARRTPGYPPYDVLRFEVPMREAGDVNARVWIRIEEVEQSLSLVGQILDQLPSGRIHVDVPVARDGAREGVALVEGFRGDILVWLRLDAGGQVERCHLRDPSWFQWPLLEAAVEGNIVADFPLCNKSFNCSYSGHDL
jgi:Ni,Fe-hydrogenase III large subunit/Ni,Fe-hydrogenase III component G